jgi:hypothetical protein
MGYQWANAKPGIGRPVPNKAHPLWNGCLFASCVGSSRGHRQLGTPQGDFDDRFYPNAARSTIFTAGGFTPNGANWQNWSMGRGFNNGDGTTSLNPEGWENSLGPTIPGVGTGERYDLPQLGATPIGGCTWAVIIRPDLQTADINVPFFKRRAQPYGLAQVGWHWSGGAGNTYRIEISSGAVEFARVSTTVQDVNGMRSDLLVARYIHANATNSRLELYVNGVAEAGVAGSPSFATVPIGNPDEPIKILGYDATDQTFPGFIPFAAFWARPLAVQEMAQLYADPFVMWRWLTGPEGFAVAGRSSLRQDVQPGQVLGAMGDVVFSDFAPGVGGAAGGCCNCCAPSAISMF